MGQLKTALESAEIGGTLYIGYPVLATADEKVIVDALLVSEQHGVVAFLFVDGLPLATDVEAWERLGDDQDRLYYAVKNNLMRHDKLRARRELGIGIQTATVFPTQPQKPEIVEGNYCDMNGLPDVINSFSPIPTRFIRPLHAALQRVTTIKPVKKREKVSRPESRGAALKRIETEIANLDQWQKRAAIESPEGPQRIRGLAGSGKTVVLALKAAYLHGLYPDWIIAVTFHSRSLYQQFRDLIRRFCYDTLNEEPNWQNLRVIHAWGSSDRDGVYTEIARRTGHTPRDFLYGKSRFGMNEAFLGVCTELLSATEESLVEPIYDAVLVDEAQDLPLPFFRLIYRFTRNPKRIIWAYDELQILSESVMPPTSELFGNDENGDPRVRLSNAEGSPRQDVMLPVCYRNTPWALTLAHALGFGIYRKERLVQHFDDPALWTEIGYRVLDGELTSGESVTLERNPDSYPQYFQDLLRPDDAILWQVFEDEGEQAEWVASSIKRNLNEDELDVDDILIILPDAYMAKKKSALIMEALARHDISSHLAGVTVSRDRIFTRDSVAIANIYRSKGNEAPMVYVLDCQHCFSGHELIKLRNILFTAITRSRAWVRLCGWGNDMKALADEMEQVSANHFHLSFCVPTLQELRTLRKIHRDRTVDEKLKIRKLEHNLKEFLDALQQGDLVVENLPPELRTRLAQILNQRTLDDYDPE